MPKLDELRRLLAKGVGKTEPRNIREGATDWGDDSAEADHLDRVDLDAMTRGRQRHGKRRPPDYTLSKDGDDAIIRFGKFAGRTVSDIYREEPGYVAWMIKEFRELDPEFSELCREVIRRAPKDTKLMSPEKAGDIMDKLKKYADEVGLPSPPAGAKKLVDSVIGVDRSSSRHGDRTAIVKARRVRAKDIHGKSIDTIVVDDAIDVDDRKLTPKERKRMESYLDDIEKGKHKR